MERRKHILIWLVAATLIGSLLGAFVSSAITSAGSKKIRRTILLNFKPEASPAEVQKILQDATENITQIKGVRNVVAGPQTNQLAGFKYGISMDFDDEAALKAYREDSGHRETHNRYVHLIEQSQISDIREE